MPKAVRDAPGLTETERLETFCDGVFAIAITLLVLEIRGPSEEAVSNAGSLFPASQRCGRRTSATRSAS